MTDVRGQNGHRIRLDWGVNGAVTVAGSEELAVVVDVLSFTTTLSVAVDLGAEVYPYRWRDDGAEAYARRRDAEVAVGRLEAGRGSLVQVSLSPVSLREVRGLERLVLPSPNGSTISATLRDRGTDVVGACLRNRRAVAEWVLALLLDRPGCSLAVVPAGEQWDDGALRPAVEDLWGAGAVLDSLLDLRPALEADLSEEARVAVSDFRAVRERLTEALLGSVSGAELIERGYRDDVLVAAEIDSTTVVPVLRGDRFVAA